MKRPIQHVSGLFRLLTILLILLAFLENAPARAACSNPTSAERHVIYNGDCHIYQFCNGTTWMTAGQIMSPGSFGNTIGDSNVEGSTDTGDGNYIISQPATLGHAATIQSISMYVNTVAGNLRLGIYDATGPSGGPGAKKAETNGFTPSGGWNTSNVITPVSLPAGNYWLAFLTDNNSMAFAHNGSAPVTDEYYAFTYGTMPATFSTTPSAFPGSYSLYATFTSSCANPTASERDVIYNGDFHTLQYCNGASWVQMGSGGSSQTSIAAPVAWWKFDESSGTTANDSIGSDNGTLTNGPTWQTAGGKFAGALQFDGVNDYVGVGNPANLNFGTSTSFSVSLWVYPTADVGSYDMPLNHGGAAAGNLGYDFELGAAPWKANIADASTAVGLTLSGSDHLNTWSHLVIVADRTANTFTAYFNGVQVDQQSIAGLGSVTATHNFDIGDDYSATYPFQGKIDDLRVYNYALSAAQVNAIYNYSGSCSNPTAGERDVIYNGDFHTYQYCNGTNWVKFGGGSSVPVTTDAVFWTVETAVGANWWNSVTYGNGLFVAVAAAAVMTSPDGITWTARTAPGGGQGWNSVTYGNNLFVAVADSAVMTSPDGITWTLRTAAENNLWDAVTYGNNLFVAAALNGTHRVMTSPDGITWTARTVSTANQWIRVTYGNGKFAAISGGFWTSPDGITWTLQTTPFGTWYDMTYGGGQFVAVGAGFAATSPDGITWTSTSGGVLNDGNWYAVTYGSGRYVAVSAEGKVMTSPDGATWTLRTGTEANWWYSIAYGNGTFVTVAGSGSGTHKVMISVPSQVCP